LAGDDAVILLDTSGLLANYDRSDRRHGDVARILARPQRRILSPFVLAELDYLVAQVAGQAAELIVLEDVARGAYQLEPFDAANVAAARTVIERYADLRLGLADASIAVLAERYGCLDVLTLDQRHFRSIRGPKGTPFRLLPDDERRPASPTGH
jgi:predicted nucleic acid-binding protein